MTEDAQKPDKLITVETFMFPHEACMASPEIARKFTAEKGFTREFTSATTVSNKILPSQFALCDGPVAVANSGQSAAERSVGNTPVFPPLYSHTLPQTSQPHDGLTCNIRARYD